MLHKIDVMHFCYCFVLTTLKKATAKRLFLFIENIMSCTPVILSNQTIGGFPVIQLSDFNELVKIILKFDYSAP